MSLVWVPPVYPKTRFYEVITPPIVERKAKGWVSDLIHDLRVTTADESKTEKNRRRRRRQGRLRGGVKLAAH